jgi:hypothetical protein
LQSENWLTDLVSDIDYQQCQFSNYSPNTIIGWYWDDKTDEWREHQLPDVSHVRRKQFRATIDGARLPRLPRYAAGQFAATLIGGLALLDWRCSWRDTLLATWCVTHACVAIGGLFMLDASSVGRDAAEAIRLGGEDASERDWYRLIDIATIVSFSRACKSEICYHFFISTGIGNGERLRCHRIVL